MTPGVEEGLHDRRPPTMYDVARVAGVSHQTVSRFVKGFAGIRPATRERVEAAIDALGYRPNLVARSLATKRSRRIVALVHELIEVGPSKTLNGAANGAREAGYLLDIVSLDHTAPGAVADAVRMLDTHDLAGVLAFGPTTEVNDAFRSAGIIVPVLVATDEWPGGTDELPGLNGAGLALVVEYLVEHGHQMLFHVTGPDGWLASEHRNTAYSRLIARHGLVSAGSATGDWSAASGYEAVAAMPLDRGITAVVVANDQMALGALRALAERGVAVPAEVSVVGFDDIPEAAFYQPPLTTVRVDFDQQGRRAVNRLLQRIGEPVAEEALDVVVPELVVRESSTWVRGRASADQKEDGR